MRIRIGVLSCGLLLVSMSAYGQQPVQPTRQPNGMPGEYIESSSPVPGGGIVASVYAPGRGGPVYRRDNEGSIQESSMRQNNANGQMVSPAPSNPANGVIPAGGTMYGQTTYQVPAASRIPSLGVPTNWNRAIQPGQCANCNQLAAPSPYRTLQPTSYQVPPVTTSGYAGPPPQGYVAVQNLPPNAYMGTGIFGSTRQYIDGQPVRNLFRYVFP